MRQFGPKTKFAQEIHAGKYRSEGEDYRDYANRVAGALTDTQESFYKLRNILGEQKFLPGGRIQSAIGSARMVTAFNCFVSGTIEDDSRSILDRQNEAFFTMRLGGGIGYDFSRIRPRGDRIKSLASHASGPISFMGMFDAACQTVSSAGHRRGAQMGVLRIDHPDIFHFVKAKRDSHTLQGFNISVGVTDAFMEAMRNGDTFDLVFEGKVYETINPKDLWNEIMRNTFDWAEPGVLFLDRINDSNNLKHIELIEATNPCGEQPLPEYGACLLGSFNLTKYCEDGMIRMDSLIDDIPAVVEAMDNIIDRTIYPLPQQDDEAKAKRRMGLGLTGLANALEYGGHRYGYPSFVHEASMLAETLFVEAYKASALLAEEKGAYPLWDLGAFKLTESWGKLPKSVQTIIAEHGLRNSHLTSIAPTGTISLTADNISSGIEPPFSLEYHRTVKTFDGEYQEVVQDYAYREWGIEGRTANQIPAETHIDVLAAVQYWVDSACSKTCNVGDHVTFNDFKELYTRAWKKGCKGVTTFRAAGKRMGILQEKPEEKPAEACYIDPVTGQKECS